MQGMSFAEKLTTGEEPDEWRTGTYYRCWMDRAHRHANPAHFGIRTKDYKLIFFYGRYWKDAGEVANIEGWGNRYDFETPPAWEFYDLRNDPHEMDNRYRDDRYHDVINELKADLLKLREELGEDDEIPEIQKLIDDNCKV